MSDLIYDAVKPVKKREAKTLFKSEDRESLIMAMLGAAYYIDDWRWVQDHCLNFLGHPDPGIRKVAALCLGHIARIHGSLDEDKVFPVLKKLSRDSEIGKDIAYELKEIKWYLRNPP